MSGSDRLIGFARKQFGSGAAGSELLHEVATWVGSRLSDVPGSSGPTDGASGALVAGADVCRDYAHLAISMLRELDPQPGWWRSTRPAETRWTSTR